MEERHEKQARLEAILSGMDSVLVAFSGGVDSTYLAAVAQRVLGDRAVAVTAVSPAIPRSEVDEATALAQRIGIRHEVIESDELQLPEYVANPPDRCYHCKHEVFGRLHALADELGLAHVADGSNTDDVGDHRPGRRAAAELGVRSPLLEAGFSKDDIRAASRDLGLPTWDKPSLPCLASRIPYGTAITLPLLRRIEEAEAFLRSLGIRQLRVRHHGDVARIEVDGDGMTLLRVEDVRRRVVDHIRSLGYLYVTLDLAGFRSGSLNEPLRGKASTPSSRPSSGQ